MEKVKVYVAWERENSDKLNERGKISLKKVQVYEFNTQGEADAFCKGIDEATGWDEPMWVKEHAAEVKEGKLIIKKPIYYAIYFDGDYLATGLNFTDPERVKEDILSLNEPQMEEEDFEQLKGMSLEDICTHLGYILEKNNNPI